MPGLGAIASFIGVRGFIAIGLALALLISHLSDKHHIHQRDNAIQQAANERAAHAVTKASLEALIAKDEALVKDGKQREEAARKAVEAQKAASASIDRQIARLRSARPTTPPEPDKCPTPSAVGASEGL